MVGPGIVPTIAGTPPDRLDRNEVPPRPGGQTANHPCPRNPTAGPLASSSVIQKDQSDPSPVCHGQAANLHPMSARGVTGLPASWAPNARAVRCRNSRQGHGLASIRRRVGLTAWRTHASRCALVGDLAHVSAGVKKKRPSCGGQASSGRCAPGCLDPAGTARYSSCRFLLLSARQESLRTWGVISKRSAVRARRRFSTRGER